MSEPLPETRALSNEAPRKLNTEWKKTEKRNIQFIGPGHTT